MAVIRYSQCVRIVCCATVQRANVPNHHIARFHLNGLQTGVAVALCSDGLGVVSKVRFSRETSHKAPGSPERNCDL
jgi:hypothetical protein